MLPPSILLRADDPSGQIQLLMRAGARKGMPERGAQK
jgi:hypothetical protein